MAKCSAPYLCGVSLVYRNRQAQQTAAQQLCLHGLRSHCEVEEQGQGYGYPEAYDYEFSSSPYGTRKMAYLLLLWPGFTPFDLAWRSSRLTGILDQRSKDIIYMTGPDLGLGDDPGLMKYVVNNN